MRPEPARFLAVAAGHLMTKTAGAVDDAYEQSSVSVMGLMLTQLADEFERAAARRFEENRALRLLFELAIDAVEDAELGGRLAEAADNEDADLRISELERTNCDLRALLIELHEHVEELETEAAREIESDIWRELAVSTERRRLGIGPF